MNSNNKKLEKLLRSIKSNTEEEERDIQSQIVEDDDTWEFSGAARQRGRPKGRTKQQVTVSLDIDLIEALSKPEKKGWQTRLNAAARAGLGLYTKA